MVELFRKYADKYDVDFLLMMAQGYQESRLDQKVEEPRRRRRRHAGHAGHRQGAGRRRHLAARAQHPRRREVHAVHDRSLLQGRADDAGQQGAVHVRFLQRRTGADSSAPQEAERRGLDPNVWFNNVEIVAAEKIGAETVTYVSNIYKYYVTYRLVTEDIEREKKK